MAHLTEHNLHSIEDMIRLWLTDYRIAQNVEKHRSVISRLFERYPRDTFIASEVILARTKVRSDCTSEHCRIELWSKLHHFIVTHIKRRYSPEQVAGAWVEQQFRFHWTKEILSKDTVYHFIYEHYPSLIKKYFRRRGKKYRNRIKEKADGKYQLQQRRMISERNIRYPTINKRNKYWERKLEWHWEWDTIIGRDRKSVLLTIVDRKSGYLIVKKLALGKNATGLLNVMKEQVVPQIPQHLRTTLTFDNWREFAEHRMMEYHTGFTIYFAHPYHSWERGTNENTNWLLRTYFPKGTDFNTVTEEELEKVQKQINMRPRKRLNYRTPFDIFHSY
jgi:IS30 family transposase